MLLFLLGLYLGVELLGHGEVVCLALVDTRFFFLNKFLYLFIFWLCWVFVSVRGLSPVAASGGPLFIAVRGPLTIAASLVAEHRLQTRRLSNCGSRA